MAAFTDAGLGMLAMLCTLAASSEGMTECRRIMQYPFRIRSFVADILRVRCVLE